MDRTRDPGSIDPVNPVTINSVEQSHEGDRIAVVGEVPRAHFEQKQ